MLNQARKTLGAGSYSEVSIRLNALQNEKAELKKTVESLNSKLANSEANAINNEFIKGNGYEVLIKYLKDSNRNAVTSLVDKLKVSHPDSVIVFIGNDNGSLPVICSVNGEALKAYKAGDLVRLVAGELGGSGGGRPDFASGAGKDASKVDEALAKAKELVK